jgi:hypothetical protein
VPAGVRAPAESPAPAGRGVPAGRGMPVAQGAPRDSPARAGRGADLGLVIACLGLLAAAAMLGLSEDGRAATTRSRRRLAGLLRPLLGGRR